MLNHEDQIKGNADICEAQLERVSRDATPVSLKAGVNDKLQQGEHPASNIEHDLQNTPSSGRFTLEIEQSLRNVLDKCANKLDIAQGVELW